MRISLFLPTLFTSFCSAQLKPCYGFSGPISQIPCDPTANVSACCAPGGSCETNLHCHGQGAGDQFERVGGCTDESGYDPACPFPFLRGKSSFRLFIFMEDRVGFAYTRVTQILLCGIGSLTMQTLPTAAMEHSV